MTSLESRVAALENGQRRQAAAILDLAESLVRAMGQAAGVPPDTVEGTILELRKRAIEEAATAPKAGGPRS